ncbi:hypothetical protein BDR03DRAFT_229958 [Suillus americanus]|nr:hypothetical protein BDR03DRAFT_229958 [Suillus americanus]
MLKSLLHLQFKSHFRSPRSLPSPTVSRPSSPTSSSLPKLIPLFRAQSLFLCLSSNLLTQCILTPRRTSMKWMWYILPLL